MLLFDEDLQAQVAEGTGSFNWTSVTGEYYLALTPSPSDDTDYTLSITGD
jgi:hypothetical protein